MKHLFNKYLVILIFCMIVICSNACTSSDNYSDKADTVCATVIEIEKYGHAVLDITTSEFTNKGFDLGDVVFVHFDSYESDIPFFDGYYTKPGSAMLRGLSPEENIAICINYGDFSEETGISLGDEVEISMKEKSGMLTYQELCALKYSNERSDYSDDATFANFRAVTTGLIGDGKLYRSASPINNQHGRASYANHFIEMVGVATVLNLADSDEDIAEYYAADDFDSKYYHDLYKSGNVIALDLTGNFYSDKFATSIVHGLSFLAKNNPPYSIHCTEGKDRAGFTVMLLEALMGADLQEIIDDYMLSFYNYYGIDKEQNPEKYDMILNNNLLEMLYHITGTDSREALENTDLEFAATNYLLCNGMTENDILLLKEKLR